MIWRSVLSRTTLFWSFLSLFFIGAGSGSAGWAAQSPSITINRSLTINENSGTTNINFTVTDSDSDPNTLTVAVHSSNQTLVTDANLAASGTGVSRTLAITTSTNASGSATIQLIVSDADSNKGTNTVALLVNLVNHAPSFTLSTNLVTTAEDTSLTTTNFLTSISRGPTNESAQSLTFVLTTTNRSFFTTQPALTSSGILTFKPAPDVTGTNTLTVTLEDSGGTAFGGTNRSAAQTLDIVVTPVNDAPVIAALSPLTIKENSGTTNISFRVTDIDSDIDSVTVAAHSSNQSLVPDANLTASGSGTNRTLAITTLTNAVGSATIQLVATDSQSAKKTNTLSLVVNLVNQAPSFSLSTNAVVAAEEASVTVPNFALNLSPGAVNESAQGLTFLLSTTNRSFFAAQPSITPSGTLTFKLAANVNGTNTVSVVLQDNGGTSSGGTNQSAPQTFDIAVTPVNDAPVLLVVSTLSIKADSGTTNLIFTVTDVDSEITNVTVTAHSSIQSLVTNTSLVISGTGTNRTLAITPTTNAVGKSTIQLIATDSSSAKSTNTFTLVVNLVNHAPTFTLSTNVVFAAEEVPLTLTNFVTATSPGAVNESDQGITFIVTTTNKTFFAVQPAITSLGTLTFKPAVNVNGTNTLTVVLQDNGGFAFGGTNRSAPQTFDVVVTPTNDPPVIGLIPPVTLRADHAATNLTFKVTDIDSDISGVTVFIRSSNTNLVTTTNLVVTGTGTNRTLSISTLSNAVGKATLQLVATDSDSAMSTNTLSLVVNLVNQPPGFTLATNVVVAAEETPLTLTNFVTNISPGPTNEFDQGITFLLTTTNKSFFATQPAITAQGTLTLKPALNVNGTNTVTVVLQDNGGTAFGGTNKSAPQTFSVVVTPGNDPPVLSIVPTLSIKADNGATNVAFKVTDVDSEISSVTVIARSSNQSLVTDTNLVVTGTGTNRTLAITPSLNAFGKATIKLVASDSDLAKSTNTLSLVVNLVNRAPSFTLSTNVVVAAEDTALTLTNFVSNLNPGATNEIGQGLTFLLTPTNRLFFSVQPAITSGGTLTFKPALNASGTNAITVSLLDNGGSAFGGTNQSAPQTFSIVVAPGNDPPAISILSSLGLKTGAGTTNVPFKVTDVDSEISGITVTARSSNTNLVTDANLVITGTGTNRTLSITPSTNSFGKAAIELVATDSQSARSTNTLSLSVNLVNRAPSFVLLTNAVYVTKNAAATVISNYVTSISAGAEAESSQSLTFRVTSANSAFFLTQPAISSGGTLSFRPATNVTGTNVLTVYLQDSGGTSLGGSDTSAAQTFSIVVAQIGTSPVLAQLPDLRLNTNAMNHPGAADLRTFVTDADSALTNIQFRIANLTQVNAALGLSDGANGGVAGTPVVTIGLDPDSGSFKSRPGTGSQDNTIHVHPRTNFMGLATVTIEARDSDGNVSNQRSFNVTIAGVGAPIITGLPASLTVAASYSATFNMTATGDEPFTYQWRKSGANVLNATDASYTIDKVLAGHGGNYTIVVSNDVGSMTSSPPAVLTVQAPLAITTFAGVSGIGTASGTGSAARFNHPNAVAADSAANIYVADTLNHMIRKITPAGAVTTLAGLAGVSGSVDGTGTAARFFAPRGVAVDTSGNVYVADTGNGTIRKITSAGVVTTLAGRAGPVGSLDGTGSAARFNNPYSVALDSSGNVFVADRGNHTLRKITAAGVVSTLAGVAGSLGSAEGSGSAARFNAPAGVATDSTGNIYVAEFGNNTIRKVTPAGLVSTLASFAGTVGNIGSADGTANLARFNRPVAVAVDSTGNVYVADLNNQTIRKITAEGVVSTLAGTARSSGSTDGTGSAARFNLPSGVAVDSTGNIYVADQNNQSIRKITSGGVVSTLAGQAGYGSTDGTGAAAQFYGPNAVAVDSSGNVYVADYSNFTIRKISASRVVTTLAGSAGESGSENGTGSAARFSDLTGIAVDSVGNIYVTDGIMVRKITSGGVVSTLAGSAENSGSTDGPGSDARFGRLTGVAVDGSRNLYLSDGGNNTIRKITSAGVVSTLAGTTGEAGVTDGTGSTARFSGPAGVALDSTGNVYVADYNNFTVRKVTSAGVVSTLAGAGGDAGTDDGQGTAARFGGPSGVAVDSAGSVFVVDAVNNTIRKITASGLVTTLAGAADGSFGSTDGTGSAARLNNPTGVAVDKTGILYVADSLNNTVRKGVAGSLTSADLPAEMLIADQSGVARPLAFVENPRLQISLSSVAPVSRADGEMVLLRMLITSASGTTYVLEAKESLTDSDWTPVASVNGDGTVIELTDPSPSASQRFYRVRIEPSQN
jgi:hypothetical protein